MTTRVLAIALLALCLILGGCVGTSAEDPPPPPAAGGMGGGMGGEGGESGGMVEGFVAAPGNCVLEMGSGSRVSSDGVLVSRVVAPADGWVVIDSTLSPGRVLGKTWVPKGESRDVLVELTLADSARATVSLHVDRGEARTYEFDEARPLRSADAQVYVARAPVRLPITLSGFGSEAMANTALLQVESQRAGAASIRVPYALVPGPSWISVIAVDDDGSTRLLGRTWRAAGEFQEVVVPLGSASQPGLVLVTLHRDAGRAGRFDFSPTDPLGSADQPYRSAGEVAIKQVRLSGD